MFIVQKYKKSAYAERRTDTEAQRLVYVNIVFMFRYVIHIKSFQANRTLVEKVHCNNF